MALGKTIKSANGILMTYHRIDHFETSQDLTIFVKSYADESYRLSEKKAIEDVTKSNELRSRISEEMNKRGTDEYDEELIKKLTEEANKLGFPTIIDVSILTRQFQYPLDKTREFSYHTFYDWLKSEDIFKDAEDILD